MRRIPGLRNLLLAAATALITTIGAVVVILQPADTTRKITGTNAAAPGLGWSLDAATTYGHAGARFRDPTDGTQSDMHTIGFVDAGATLLTVLGIPNGDTRELRNPELFGIDAATGTTRWRTPAPDLDRCAAAPVDGRLVCHTFGGASGKPALIGYDIATGSVTRTPTDWDVLGLAAMGDHLYVTEKDYDSYSDDLSVHAGTLTNPDAFWTRTFADADSSGSIDVSHGQGVLGLGGNGIGFDLATGAPTWTTERIPCSETSTMSPALVVRIRAECHNGVIGSDLIDRTGRTIASTDRNITHRISIDAPADDSVPILLADSAYDRRTGALVWTSPDLRSTTSDPKSLSGTAIAVLGDTALLQDLMARTMTGLDMHTGRRLWQFRDDRLPSLGDWDGSRAVFIDTDGLRAIDLRTGKTVWDIPFLAINDKPHTFDDQGHLTAHRGGRYFYTSARTMISLRPLP
ncbi:MULTISPECIES: PQQ-binding-like beta-propeller repeat protein [unclassified Nocardia]|uniref:outer membrane protein assembly factor BamB family protein n=1 Tax=unclassified Nocardia TaxID=2637762 RepID=UPI001CE41D7B|nr:MULTISPECIES: PQQ-binding-like beta-propeller repeat protein [unclassified Nocardia]